MEQKKNPKADLNRNRGLFFITGLVLVMALAYIALEWKTYETTTYDTVGLNVADDLWEEVPFMEFKTPPPPPPPAPVIPDEITIEEDDADITETLIDTTELDPEEEVKYEDLDVVEIEEPDEIPFIAVENVPIFPGCEKVNDKKACFEGMIAKHIQKNFQYPELEKEMGIQGRVSVIFVIQKDGSIGNVRMRGPNKNLEKEAARIIDKLPKMTPGKQRGRAVKVPFSIPITFVLQ
ncbi:energy transducer TonB [Maribacter sp. 2-571]|uniref:energy transducer TonB n=1 Tax=Maribacter sp. 2-571 TaxID=3417569 RepID=UPI003D34C624